MRSTLIISIKDATDLRLFAIRSRTVEKLNVYIITISDITCVYLIYIVLIPSVCDHKWHDTV